jgi:hypothetical protein
MTFPAELTLALEHLTCLKGRARYRRRVRRLVLTGRPMSMNIRRPAATGPRRPGEVSWDSLESRAQVAETTNMDWLGTEGLTSA